MPRVHPSNYIGPVVAAAFLMMWPALYNRYPLLYPDSMAYLENGPLVARALFLQIFSDDYGQRSLIYCLGILPLHLNVTAWPIVALNALLTAYVIWLTMHSVLPKKTAIRYLALVLLLSIFTGLSWSVSWIMPDILGPALYLSIYILVFAPQRLSRTERVIVVLIAWWSMASHITHLLLAAGICVFLVLFLLLRHPRAPRQWRSVVEVAMIITTVAAVHISLHWYLYGKPSLRGKGPPFLLARVIADGPGRWYLEQRCGGAHFEVCTHVHDLSDDVDDFLWGDDGIWLNSSEEQRERLQDEEMAIVAGTLREYPRQELMISADHFWEQLHTFGLSDYDPNPWVLEVADTVMPVTRSRYIQTRQAQETLHEKIFAFVQDWTVIASLVVIGIRLTGGRHRSRRAVGLTAIIAIVVIGNAAVTGVLSKVDDRYQARVIWLVPLLAGVLELEWRDHSAIRRALADRLEAKGRSETVTFHFSKKLPRGRAQAASSRGSSHRAEMRGACPATTPA